MAIPKFYLRRRADKNGVLPDKNIPVELNYSFRGLRLQYYTGISVDARHFVPEYFKTGKLPIKSAAPRSEYLNDVLKIIQKTVEDFEYKCKHDGYSPTVDDFRRVLDQRLKGKGDTTIPVKSYAIAMIDPYLDFTANNKAHNTFRNTKSAMNHLKAYLKRTKNDKLIVEDINQDIYNSFRAYLIKKGHKNNTVVKNLTRFRAYHTWLGNEGLSTSTIKYELKENDIGVIALTEEELEVLTNAVLTDQRSIIVRDVFLFGCYTGLRYGDILNLKKTDVYDDCIKFLIQKNGDTVNHTVPLMPISRHILNTYIDCPGDVALPCYSNQKMNKYLKELMLSVGFTDKETVAEKSGNGKISRVVKEKWELITCHTSRKTFSTMMLSRGMSEVIIKSITGHSKNSKAFSKYYTVSDKLKEQEMSKVFDK